MGENKAFFHLDYFLDLDSQKHCTVYNVLCLFLIDILSFIYPCSRNREQSKADITHTHIMSVIKVSKIKLEVQQILWEKNHEKKWTLTYQVTDIPST